MPHSLKKLYPKIFIDWHPTLNGKVAFSLIDINSRKKYWWRCHKLKCGCNWKATIYARVKLGDKCPKCKERWKKKFPDDLGRISEIFKEMKVNELKIDKSILIFTDDISSKTKKRKNAAILRKCFGKINELNLELRKLILGYKNKMVSYRLTKKIANKKLRDIKLNTLKERKLRRAIRRKKNKKLNIIKQRFKEKMMIKNKNKRGRWSNYE